MIELFKELSQALVNLSVDLLLYHWGNVLRWLGLIVVISSPSIYAADVIQVLLPYQHWRRDFLFNNLSVLLEFFTLGVMEFSDALNIAMIQFLFLPIVLAESKAPVFSVGHMEYILIIFLFFKKLELS